MSSRFFRCRSLWGTADWIVEDPAVRRLTSASYRPWSAEAPFGLSAEPEPAGSGGVEEGPFLYIGELATHYGHFLINTLPRLWPLVSWDGPPPRLLCRVSGPREAWSGLPFLGAILRRLGMDAEAIVSFDGMHTVTDVVVPEPALREQAAVHAVFAELCRRIGQPLWRDVATDAVTRPLYLSKTRLRSGSRMP